MFIYLFSLYYELFFVVIIGSQWPANFDDLNTEPDILETDTLRVIGQTDDPLLQNKLKENVALAEAATRALEHIYEEEPLPAPVVEQLSSPKIESETISTIATSDNTSAPIINGTEPSSPPTTPNDNPSATLLPANGLSTDNNEISLNSTIPPPPPSSSAPTSPNTIAPATAVATTLPLAHSAAAIQAAYRQTSLLGALPTASAIRAASGALYATAGGLANSLTGQVIYGGKTNFKPIYFLKLFILLYHFQVFH